MRELILEKIEYLKRWAPPEYYHFDFSKLSDRELVEKFVEFIRRTFQQR